MALTLPAYEKLGQFYLGRVHDLSKKQTTAENVMYDSKDLVTHAVCVGMTGSGKTGLCIDILEEAAIDNIPAIVIDPKGDLANLLLTFPDLKPEDFKPWINPDDAARKGLSEDEFAAQQARLWSDGLAKWEEDGDRIRRLKNAADFAIYTPGSNAGIPVSILKSFDVPPQEVIDDNEAFGDRISTTATSLLGLLGIDADPVQSREHILISNILSDAWQKNQNLDMAALIQAIQQPAMSTIGVMDLNSFYPQKDRFALAMQLNNLLAAPGFAQWMEGIPLDIGSILHTGQGKPRVAIFSIAHLSDPERMFFVSLLLNQMLGWMRSQGGTTSLRALFYMDEIFGYFPPSANPPSKQPLLTLLKQARAFGLGIMLATQNPVDLDYKGLANCGTWFVGRLQTDRDKQRLLDGLEGAAASASQKFNKAAMEQTLAGLGSRVFLMNNVHEDEPVIFESRWAMSYLRGPLGKADIRKLMEPQKSAAAPAGSSNQVAAASSKAPGAASARTLSTAGARPVLPPTIAQYFLPVRGASTPGATLAYQPMLLGTADVYFIDKANKVDTTRQMGLLAPIVDGPVPVEWTTAAECDVAEGDLSKTPDPGATFADLPATAAQQKNIDLWSKSFADGLYRICKLEIFKSDDTDLSSNAGESERDFRVRLTQTLREERDAAIEKTRQKFASKLMSLGDRLRRAQMAQQKEQQEASSSKWTAALSVGASVLGAFFGRKTLSASNMSKIGTAARQVGNTVKQSGDVARAEENAQAIQQELDQVNASLQADIDALTAKYDPSGVTLTKLSLRPKKTDIKPRVVALAWAPGWKDASGNVTPAWE